MRDREKERKRNKGCGVTSRLIPNKFIIANDQSVSIHCGRFCPVNYEDTVISKEGN